MTLIMPANICIGVVGCLSVSDPTWKAKVSVRRVFWFCFSLARQLAGASWLLMKNSILRRRRCACVRVCVRAQSRRSESARACVCVCVRAVPSLRSRCACVCVRTQSRRYLSARACVCVHAVPSLHIRAATQSEGETKKWQADTHRVGGVCVS